jgi:Transglutaminase-like superfamily
MTTPRTLPLPRLLALALRGLWELALARWALHRIGPAGVQLRNAEAMRDARPEATPRLARHCDSIAFIIPRMARRVPWRADCLVQALAGQNWLRAAGIGSEIVVGTARSADGAFEAHAWLQHGETVILGGDIARFRPLLTPDLAVLSRSGQRSPSHNTPG